MKVKNLFVILFIFAFVSLGYAYTKDSTEKYTQPKKVTGGIDRHQALEIAKDYLKLNNLDKDYYLGKYLTRLKDGVWHIVFLTKGKDKEFGQVESIRIKIDQSTGQVIEYIEQSGYFIDKPQKQY